MQERIKNFLIGNGAGQVGFFKAGEDNPFGLTYGISFTIPLSDAIVDSIGDEPTHTYFHHYRSVNTLIDNISLKAGIILGKEGFKYVPVPASQSVNGLQGIFSHKYGAYLAGLGYVGRSGLFVSSQNGPRVRLGTILTDYPFLCNEEMVPFSCGDCKLCTVSCPAMAIRGENWNPGEDRERIIDAKACSDFMKKKFQHIGRGVVCGICMKVCPKGQKMT
ncbi:MAG: epoxyqueuosine reductase [Clostridia bacterium]|nr:epoxyqueuosine reductase [Clostridia bacterium]